MEGNSKHIRDDEKVDQIKSRLPPKLKVIAEAWNPVLELLALAFEGGKLMVKAVDRKTCWKRNINEEHGIIKNVWKSVPACNYEIQSMTWSPDGEILAVSTNCGFIHMLTASAGKIGYTVEGKTAYEKLIWEKISLSNKIKKKEDFLSFATASSFNFNDEAPKECAQQIADMEDFFHKQVSSFSNTILIGVTDESLLHLYMEGTLYFITLDVCQYYEIGDYADRTSLKLLDCIVSEETKSLHALYQITEMEMSTENESKIVSNAFRVDYDLGWGRETLGALTLMSSSFFKINFLLIFLREMGRYTAIGLEEGTENFYQKVIRSFHFNYKTTLNTPWTFFHEMIQHLLGHPVSTAYFDSLRKGRGGSGGGPLHYPKLINEFNEKRLGILFSGLRYMARATETILGCFKSIIDCYTSEFLEELPMTIAHDDPEASPQLRELYSYYCDVVVLQKLIEKIRTLVDSKRRGFVYLANYFTQVNAKHDESFRGHSQTLYLDNFHGAEFFDFIGECVNDADVRIPTSLLTSLIPNVPKAPKSSNARIAKRNIINIIAPIGCYPLPRYVPYCNSNCPHNSAFSQGKEDPVILTPNEDMEQEFQKLGNLRKINPIASVYAWETEKCFDFFTKFFPEYGSAKYPPQAITDVMNDKLKEILENDAYFPSLKNFYGKEKHSFVYQLDEKELISKAILRPTIFLAIMPLFTFESKIFNIISVKYPVLITAEITKPVGRFLPRLRRTDSDALQAITRACIEVSDDTTISRYSISQEDANELTEKFLFHAIS